MSLGVDAAALDAIGNTIMHCLALTGVERSEEFSQLVRQLMYDENLQDRLLNTANDEGEQSTQAAHDPADARNDKSCCGCHTGSHNQLV